MAYNFNTGTVYLEGAAPLSAAPVTLATRIKFTTPGGANETMVAIGSDSVVGGFQLRFTAAGLVEAITVAADNSLAASTNSNSIGASSYEFAAAVFASDSSRICYANNTASILNTTTKTPPVTLNKLTVGGRRNGGAVGNIIQGAASFAEVAVWSAALNADEIASMVAGYSPRLIRPASLVFLMPLVLSSVELREGTAITTTGGAGVGTHARILGQ